MKKMFEICYLEKKCRVYFAVRIGHMTLTSTINAKPKPKQ